MKKKSMLKRMAAVFMGTVMLLGTAGAVSSHRLILADRVPCRFLSRMRIKSR